MRIVKRMGLVVLVVLVISCARAFAGHTTLGADAALAVCRKAGLPGDSNSLLAYLQGLSLAADDLPSIETLIGQLGSPRFQDRERAGLKLVALGYAALPALRRHRNDSDLEVAHRAKECITKIEHSQTPDKVFLPLAAIRLLVQQPVKGTVEVLLGYLPLTANTSLEEEIYYSLDQLALSGGRLHPALVKGLTDKLPARRAVAACIVGRRGSAEQRKSVHQLLADADSTVRLRAAQGLLASRDSAGVKTLIGLLDSKELNLSWQAEELLHWLAHDEAPAAVVGDGTVPNRRRCRSEWEGWWRRTGETINWDAVEKSLRRPGLLFVEEVFPGQQSIKEDKSTWHSRIVLYGCDGKPRYRMHSLSGQSPQLIPWFWLPTGQVAFYEEERQGKAWLTLRDATGRSLGKQTIPNGTWLDLKSLPNGNLLILTKERTILTLDVRGQVLRKQETDWSAWEAFGRIGEFGRCYLKDSSFGKDFSGIIHEIDSGTGKWVRTVRLDCHPQGTELVLLEPEPAGHILAVLGSYQVQKEGRYALWRIAPDGQISWKAELPGRNPQWLIRLRNGHTLIKSESSSPLWGNDYSWVVEVDGTGRLVGELLSLEHFGRAQVIHPLIRFGFTAKQRESVSLDSPTYRLAQLTNQSVLVRRHAAVRLVGLKLNDAQLHRALRSLTDRDRHVREPLLELALAARRHVGSESIPHLLALLNDAEVSRERDVCMLLRQHGVEATTVLMAVLEDRTQPSRKRAWAAWTLAGWLDEPKVAAVLRRTFRDPDKTVRERALAGVCGRKEAARAWVGEIVQFLKSEDRELVHTTIRVLSYLGPAGELALPALLEMLQVDALQQRVLSTLDYLGYTNPEILAENPAVIPALVRCLDSKHPPFVCTGAASVLSRMGAKAQKGVPALVKVLEDRRQIHNPRPSSVCRYIATALGTIGPGAKASVPALIAIVQEKEEDLDTRRAAVIALGKIGTAARPAVPVLLSLLEAEQPESGLLDAARTAIRVIDDSASGKAQKAYEKSIQPPLPPMAWPAKVP